ncbi:MAG: cupin domain-containing protein [Acetobacteraceae bacterium]|nr:cupin domain-containing protein [Acetobacteraceae bacterium]
MRDDTIPLANVYRSIAEMPAQHHAAPASSAQARARFFNTGNAFNVQLSPVPDMAFTVEPACALDPETPTGLIACDISAALGCDFPATSPLVLARYARIRAGESLAADFAASGVIVYVIQGNGRTDCGSEILLWGPGDVLVLPGGVVHTHSADGADAVLWIVTNEPQLAFENLRPPAPGAAPTDAVQYTGAEIRRQIDMLYDIGRNEEIAGSALIFSAERQEETRNILPTLTVAMNSLPAGMMQRPHRHNSVAVSLVISGEGCFSVIDGKRKDWSPFATTITPPVSVHSHHNGGDKQALFLIIQDGGIYYHARAMGFEFTDHPGS